VHGAGDYAGAHVARAWERERARVARRAARKAAASAAAKALRALYGEGIETYVFGSVVDAGRFRLDSDLDLAVRGLPPDRYYEAWRVAESAAGEGRLDLVRLEDAPDWLAAEIRLRGERLA
jgi:predicted nucleotidyltransferase